MQNSRFGDLAQKGKISLQDRDCAPPKLVGLSTEGQVAASVPTNHVTVAAFHLFWSTWAFSSLFMSIDCLPANTLQYML